MRALLICLLLFFGLRVSALCSFGTIYLWDRNARVGPDGQVRLIFYGMAEELVPRLREKQDIYLRSGKDSVALSVEEILKGEFRQSLVILRPARRLREGARYSVNMDALLATLRRDRLELMRYALEKISFLVSPSVKSKALQLTGCPVYVKSTYESYGCGPERFAIFQVPVTSTAGLAVRVQVTNLATGGTTEYLEAFSKGLILIGHSMCSGPFSFEEGKDYSARFALVDDAGRQGAWSEGVPFQRPEPAIPEG